MVNALGEMGAAAIVFDIVFPEADRLSPRKVFQDPALNGLLPATLDATSLPDSDVALANAFAGKPVVTAFAATDDAATLSRLVVKSGFVQAGAPSEKAPPALSGVVANLPLLDAAAAGVGGINLDLAGEQGVARQIPILRTDGTRFAPALSLEALRVAQGADSILVRSDNDTENTIESVSVGDIEIPVSESGLFYVHYRPDPKDLYISANALLQPNAVEDLRPQIEGHIVFIGTSAAGLLDVRTTALGDSVAGVSIHAQAVEQMLSGRFLLRPEWAAGMEMLYVVLGGLAIAIAGAVFRPWAAFTVTAVLSIAGVVTTLQSFKGPGLLLDMTFPLVAFTLTFLASTAWRLIITDRDGRNMRRMFGHYVSPSVLADIERNPQNLKLGGEVRDVTVMFVDIANFTPLSEKLAPEELVNTVNGLWNACSGAILQEQGTIDKFIGDAIMAFWNAPVPIADHQLHAARAALGLRRAVVAYNETDAIKQLLATKGIPPIAIRIGLASGPACVGNMGSSERFDYSVLGETVNTAARTESSCKRAAHDILLAGDMRPETKTLAWLPAGHMAMKGKSLPEPIFALVGDEDERQSHAFEELTREHNHIIAKLAERPKALATIRQLLDEMALHHPNCATYLRGLTERVEDFEVVGSKKA